MKVLIANSYFYKLDAKQWRFKKPYPPLGTLLAAAVIRDQSHEVVFFDTHFCDHPGEIIPVIEENKPDILVLYDDGFNYLTKMCLTVMRDAAFQMIRSGKKAACTVVVASSDSADHYEKYFEQGADVVVRGEGEETLKELLPALTQNNDLRQIHGIAFRSGDESIITPKRPVLRDLDALPLPAWDLINLNPYKSLWRRYHGYFSLNLATTRGCPYKCNWCAKPIYGNRYNTRSPERVTDEIEYLLSHHGPEHFWICDDIFGLKPGWVKKFNAEIKKRNLKFRFSIQSRVDLLLEPETVLSLKEAGAETIWVGAESGSQKILDAMDKGTTVIQIQEATRLLKDSGIRAAFFLQFGYPGEMKEDIEQTLKMVLQLMPDEIGISVSYPLPGTSFYDSVKTQLKEKQNWIDSDDLALMYTGQYPPSYYKVLQRYIHGRYRIQRGANRLKELIRRPKFFRGDLRKIVSMVYHTPVTWFHSFRLKRLSVWP